MSGERIIGKNVVDFLSRANARKVDDAVKASNVDLGAIVPGASQYSRFIDSQGLREAVEEFDDLPEDGVIAAVRHSTLGELVEGFDKAAVRMHEYRTNVASTIDDLREAQETGNVAWEGLFEFNASWDENLDLIIDLNDTEMQALEAAYKYNQIGGIAADERAPFALRFQNGPWEFEGFEDGDWTHSGRVIFRDSDGNTVLEKTVDDFDFPFATDMRARRDPDRTAEWVKNWNDQMAKDNVSYQPLGQPKARDAMVNRVLDMNEDAIYDDLVIDADWLERSMDDQIRQAREAQVDMDWEAEAQRDRLRAMSGWGTEEPLAYSDYLFGTQEGLLDIPPPYKSQSVLSSEEIEAAGKNIQQKVLHEVDYGNGRSTTLVAFKAEAQVEGTHKKVIADLQLSITKLEDGSKEAEISWSKAHPSAAGKGLGLRMYGAAVDYARKIGAQLTSDSSVSGDAVRMYEAMARRGGVIEDQRVTNPDNVLVTFEEWLPGRLVPQFQTIDDSPLIRVTKLPEKMPAVMLPVAPLTFQEQQFVENSPYQRIMYDVEGDNPYLFRGRQPFKVNVPKSAEPAVVAQSMLGYNGFKERERRDLKAVASGIAGEGAEEVLYNVLARSGFDHILHSPDGQVTYWNEKLALPRKQEQ